MRIVFNPKYARYEDGSYQPIWEPKDNKEYSWGELENVVLRDHAFNAYDTGDSPYNTVRPLLVVEIDKADRIPCDLVIEGRRNKSVKLLDPELNIEYSMTLNDMVNAARDGRVTDGKILGPFKFVIKGSRQAINIA